MALIDELKYKLNSVEQRIGEKHTQIREIGSILEVEEAYRNDLDRAIAALTPTPDFIAEQETAREQLEREPEIPEEGLGSSLIAMGYGDDPDAGFDAPAGETHYDEDAEASAREERPALNEAMQDEREEPVALPQPEWNEPQPTEGYALATNPEADALAKAHDWYDPKAVAERQKFNPWGGVSNLFGKPKVDA